ncbi:hypothetical protein BJX99DRAFT_69846 [Aspergillus californicus]
MVTTRCFIDSVTTICSLSHVLTRLLVTPSGLPRTSSRSLGASAWKMDESSSSPFSAQSTESSASLQPNFLETITTEAEQHNPDLSNTMNIQSSPDTRTNTLLISPPD